MSKKPLPKNLVITEMKPKPVVIKPKIEIHSTGAVRSTDANDVDYWLISPIGMYQLALRTKEYFKNYYKDYTILEHIGHSIACQYSFLSGDHNNKLTLALWHNLCAIDKIHSHEIIVKTSSDKPLGYELIPPFGLRGIAAAYNEGKKKYSEYNCEKGFQISILLNHSLKHQWDYLAGKEEEDDLGHAGWNILMSIHSFELWSHLNTNLRTEGCTPPKSK